MLWCKVGRGPGGGLIPCWKAKELRIFHDFPNGAHDRMLFDNPESEVNLFYERLLKITHSIEFGGFPATLDFPPEGTAGPRDNFGVEAVDTLNLGCRAT